MIWMGRTGLACHNLLPTESDMGQLRLDLGGKLASFWKSSRAHLGRPGGQSHIHSQNNWLMVQILWKCEFLPLNAGLGTSKPRNGQLGPWNNVVYGTARGKKSVIAPQTLGYLSAWGL